MTSQTSSEFLYNALTIESMDNMDPSSDIKLEESSNNSLIGNKRKLHVKPEAYNISDSTECVEPPSKKMRFSNSRDDDFNFPDLEIPDSTTNSNPNSTHPNTANSYGIIGNSASPHHTPYLLPVVPTHPQYFVPILPQHMPHPMSPFGHPLPFPQHINPGYLHHHNPYGQYHRHPHQVKVQKCQNTKKRKGNKSKTNETSDDTNSELLDDEIVPNNKLMTDKSPFKTTYISREEEIELKNTNNTLYSQFHHARQAIYQQYKQKSQAIRLSNVLTQEKRKLNMKVAAIDAKVQEKKLFLSYLEMSKPQPNSWLVSNTALSMNAFARKITHQTQPPSSYSAANNGNKKKNANNKKETKADNKDATNQKPKKQHTTAKRVKKPKFSEYNVRVLRDWYETHTNNPYPSSSEKHLMCQLTGLTKYQVSRWFCNVRTRKPPPELSDNDEDIIQNIKRKNMVNETEYNDYYAPHPHAAHMHPQYPPHPHAYVPPQHLNLHHLQSLNLPPMTPMTQMPITTQNAMMMNHFNFNLQNKQHNLNQNAAENNMMPMDVTNDNSEGLMPSINSDFNLNNNNQQNTNLMPPPLIDEDSRDQT
eukprot:604391_1